MSEEQKQSSPTTPSPTTPTPTTSIPLFRLDADVLYTGESVNAEKALIANACIIFEIPVRRGSYGTVKRGVIVFVGTQKDGDITMRQLLEGKKARRGSVIGTATIDDPGYRLEGRASTCFVCPGLWDCHVHFMGIKSLNFSGELVKNSTTAMAARATHDARRAVEAGFTTVREVGGLGIELRDAIDDGTLPGPTIYSAGGFLSITCGHGDLHDLDTDVSCHAMQKLFGQDQKTVDGPWEAVKQVRLQLRRGADLIKVMASGGVLSKRDDPQHREFAAEEMVAIVKEARSKGRVVAAHCHGDNGIVSALEAGCHTIEHGTWLNQRTAKLMKKQNAILIPTLFIMQQIVAMGKKTGAPKETMEKIANVVVQHKHAMTVAIEHGVRIALGTDIFSSGGDSPVPWGRHAEELQLMEDAGMSKLQVLHAATGVARDTLGTARQPHSGILRAGWDADLLALRSDPLQCEEGLRIFQDLSQIEGVWKHGQLVVNRRRGEHQDLMSMSQHAGDHAPVPPAFH